MTLRVLLVEDSGVMRALLTNILETEAHAVVVGVAETEAQAKDWLDSNADQWDLALVDLYLREGTGASVLEHCRDRRPDQTVLVMTNHAQDDALRHDCLRLGANAVFQKGSELDEMLTYCKALASKASIDGFYH
jgi:two-component system, OmpR family, response regulator